jgi:hypothetical protein
VSPPEIDFRRELRWLEMLSNINHFSPLFANSAIYFFAVLFVEQKFRCGGYTNVCCILLNLHIFAKNGGIGVGDAFLQPFEMCEMETIQRLVETIFYKITFSIFKI